MAHSRARTSAFVPHDLEAPLCGAGQGKLRHLRFAAKDMFAIAGERAGGGNPDWLAAQTPAPAHAPVITRLLAAGAACIGKTVCDEFFFSIAGANAHYGTPRNPRAPERLPGGSSSGSASAVAAGACDFALGSDTGGSVRVPAAFCGLAGLRTTHGRVSLAGVLPMAPSFDTVGWFAAAPGLLRLVADVLLDGPPDPTPLTRVLLADDMLALADAPIAQALRRAVARAGLRPAPATLCAARIDIWREAFRVLQAREVWDQHGPLVQTRRPRLGPGIAERMAFAATVTPAQAATAQHARDEAATVLRALLLPGTVVLLPTAPCPPPLLTADEAALDLFRTRTMALTCPAGLGGLPQVTLPLATEDGLPAGLSLLGPRGADEALLDLACTLAPCCGL